MHTEVGRLIGSTVRRQGGAPKAGKADARAASEAASVRLRTLARVLLPPALVLVVILLLMPLAARGFESGTPAVVDQPPPPLVAALLRPLRSVSAVFAAAAPLAPALLMAAAAALPHLMERLAPRFRVPEGGQWALGVALVLAASCLAGRHHVASLFDGGGHSPRHPREPLQLGAFETALHALRGGREASRLVHSERLVAWAAAWQAASAGRDVSAPEGGSHKLLLFGEADGSAAAKTVDAMARSLMARRAHVLDLRASTDCSGRGECASRIEHFAAAASSRGEFALVVLRHVEACASDELYDDVISAVERFLDDTPSELTTAHGVVRKSLVAFVLLAPCLVRERCLTIEGTGSAAAQELIAGGEVEALWPRSYFSPAVNAAKRAFINRLGTDLAVVCEPVAAGR